MRRPNRNIEIFSMSVLDMFASALGAFILITIVLFPDYNKKMQLQVELDAAKATIVQQQAQIQALRAEAQHLQSEAERLRAEAQQMQSQRDEARQAAQAAQAEAARATQSANQARDEATALQTQVEALKAELSKTFLVITAEWSGPADIDLHIVDTDGREFYFVKSNRNQADFHDSEGQLSADATSGPGLELFQLPVAKPGTYKVSLVFYNPADSSTPIAVKCSVFARKGRKRLPERTLSYSSQRPNVPVADIVVNNDGTISVPGGAGDE